MYCLFSYQKNNRSFCVDNKFYLSKYLDQNEGKNRIRSWINLIIRKFEFNGDDEGNFQIEKIRIKNSDQAAEIMNEFKKDGAVLYYQKNQFMKMRKEKGNIKSPKNYITRKKLTSPKLDLLKPSNPTHEKRSNLGENKIKTIPKNSEFFKVKMVPGIEKSQMEERQKARTVFKRKLLKFKEMQKDNFHNYESDNFGSSKISSSHRSVSLLKDGNSRSRRRLTIYKDDSQTIKKQTPIRRFQKFAFRSEKYFKLNSQIKTPTSSEYQKKIQSLNKDITHFKDMYTKSVKVLSKIEKMIEMEKNKFEAQRQVYQEQIKKLKNKISLKKPTIGHLYSYKEFSSSQLFPDSLIIERNDEDYSNLSITHIQKNEGKEILEKYLNSENEENSTDNLSIESK